MSVIDYDPPTPPGITPICGMAWYEKHKGQYRDWKPTIEVIRPGSRMKATIKSKEGEKAIINDLRRRK